MNDALTLYRKKRDFAVTSEPQGGKRSAAGQLSFVVQKHAASHLHYDFRLELDGTLKSWAVPKGPSLDPADKRMAVHVEDHPLDYGSFEGEIPAGQYGAGTVIVWDAGTWEAVGEADAGYRGGKLKFVLHGHKLAGGWTLVRMRGRGSERHEPWLLIKERDDAARAAADYSVVEAEPGSVLSERTIADDVATASKTATKAASKKTLPKKAVPKAVSKTTVSKTAASQEMPPEAAASKAASEGKAAPSPAAAAALPAGAQAAALPATLAPQLATLVATAPTDAGWIYEIKFDGYRLLARCDGQDVRLYTRNGNDWTDKLKPLAQAIAALGLQSSWLDGEIVVNDPGGAPDFNALQNAFDASRTEAICYYVFDLPFHAGHDLRGVPLIERRAVLAPLLEGAPERVRYSQDFSTTAEELLHNACRMRLEGVIGKRADAPYVSKRSPSWIKLKCTRRQEFVIGGWTDPQGARSGLGSLLLGVHDEAGRLVFAGGVGSGFDARSLASVRAQLDPLACEKSPFATRPKLRAHWVRPELVAEVSFGEWTPDGRIRHAVFHGLRSDKPARAITRDEPLPVDKAAAATEVDASAKPVKAAQAAKAAKAAKPSRPTSAAKPKKAAEAEAVVEGIRISHPERVIDASSGATKLDVVNHYLAVARLILPHLVKRPVSMVRAPAGLQGQLFFQRHAETLKIADLKKLDRSISPDHQSMVEVDSFAALIGAAQANVIEFHTWNATTRDATKPDRMIFDLDPGEGVGWPQIQQASELTRSLLEQLGLRSFLKTSGGKGLHVVVPIVPKEGWDTVKALSKRVVEHMAEVIPERFVAKSGPKNRVGRIFVDYLRNGFGSTTACAWSARARPGLGVSVPCAWDELAQIKGGDHWTIRNVQERIEERDDRNDPWADYAKTRQTLVRAMKALDFSPAETA